MAKFEAGTSGNLQGRPKGVKNRAQFSLSFWFNLILREYSKLTPSQRSEIALSCWKTLINKAHALPMDPTESKLNANGAMEALKQAEAGSLTNIDIKEVTTNLLDKGDIGPKT